MATVEEAGVATAEESLPAVTVGGAGTSTATLTATSTVEGAMMATEAAAAEEADRLPSQPIARI